MGATIVTGGTFGIGRAITIELAKRGHDVVAFGLETAQPSSTAENAIPGLKDELAKAGLTAELLEADVSNAQDVARVVKHALDKFGGISCLVNNAAIGPLGTVLDTPEDLWDRIVAVNLKGMYLCCRQVIPIMIEAGDGAIVNIGSGSGWGKPNMAAYSASKGGVFALGAALAYDHLADGIRVNTVVPGGGGFPSGMSLGRRGGDKDLIERTATHNPAGRATAPEDVAKAVAYLLSDDAEAITGTVLDVGCFAGQGGPIPTQIRDEPA